MQVRNDNLPGHYKSGNLFRVVDNKGELKTYG